MSSFDHLKLPLKDIQNATKNFADENIIGRDGFGKEYKGQLVKNSGDLINIVARRLDRKFGKGTKEFHTEIMMLSSLEHQNLVSIVGFCEDSDENIIINKFEDKGRLSQYLSDPTLTWAKRLYICLGIAQALSYIHYERGRSFSVIHRDVKSSKIFLGENWEAKLSGFELSTKQPASRRHDHVPDLPCGTRGYVDPEYIKYSKVSHKSDVYSLGVVLFEVLGGREVSQDNNEKRKLGQIILPDLQKEMDQESLKVFSYVADCCLKEQPAQRPHIDHVIVELRRALELQLAHENSVKDWQHLKIGFDEINLATEDFDEEYCIGEGGYAKVYKAELEHFDSSAMEEGDIQSIPPRICSTVAIKITYKEKGTEGEKAFKTEIYTLSSCKHANIVSLLGFCDEPSHLILVYEYVSNGSLDDCLKSKEKMTNLTWVRRLNTCIDIARGLDYLHSTTYYKREIIHSDIKSANILMGDNWEAKIADFGLSRFHPRKDTKSTIITDTVAGTEVYLDPEFERLGRLKKESDVYSFGVVLFEMLTGRLAYDSFYTTQNVRGLAPFVRKHLKRNELVLDQDAKLNELVDPILKEERDEEKFTLSKGPDQDSLRTFCDIGRQCLTKGQAHRPTMKVIINKLEKALYFQETRKDSLRISFEDIRSATQDFSLESLIERGEFGMLYKGEILHGDESTPIVVNRMHLGPGEKEFLKKLAILFDCKHENIIGLVGYCNKNNERISVFDYDYASNGSLDRHLKDASLTWTKRLNIAIDVSTGLDFLHGGGSTQASVIHRDIKSANILLTSEWKAKIRDFGLSMITVVDKQLDSVVVDACGTPGYVDPQYVEHGFLMRESDVYSLGVVLFEIMCGRTAFLHGHTDLVHLVKRHYEEGKLDELVFEDIKDIIMPKSLTTFQNIAYQCLLVDKEERPTAREVVSQLREALKFQESQKDTNKQDRRQISFEDIRLATNKFSNEIGRGGFGIMYGGEMLRANGPTRIAVKRNYDKYGQGEKEFQTEVKILSEYKHENIVELLGYCDENNEKILVYEYASNGSLDTHLSDADLTWTRRLKICIDVAVGLQFLHKGGATKDVVIHRDIKSHNILLNDDWKAKITDFGLSVITLANDKFDFVVDNACGTPDYCDPEYRKTGFLTTQSDIYSLGVVLVEMMYGRLACFHDQKGGQHVKSDIQAALTQTKLYSRPSPSPHMSPNHPPNISDPMFRNPSFSCNSSSKVSPTYSHNTFSRPTFSPARPRNAFSSTHLSPTHSRNAYSSTHLSTGNSRKAYSSTQLSPTHSRKAYSSTQLSPTNSHKAYSSTRLSPTHSHKAYSSTQLSPTNSHKAYSSTRLSPTHSHKAYSITQLSPAHSHKAYSSTQLSPAHSYKAYSITQLSPTHSRKAYSSTQLSPAHSHKAYSITQLSPTHSYKAYSITQLSPAHSRKAYSITQLSPTHSHKAYSITQLSPTHSHKAYSITQLSPAHSRKAYSITQLSPAHSYKAYSITQLIPAHSRKFNSITQLSPTHSYKAYSITQLSPAHSRKAYSITQLSPTRSRKSYNSITHLSPTNSRTAHSTKHFSPAHSGKMNHASSKVVKTHSRMESIVSLFRREYEDGTDNYFFLKGIMDKIAPESLTIYKDIVYQCLHGDRNGRPTARDVVSQLKKALELQENFELSVAKQSRDNEEIIQMLKIPKKLSSDVSNKLGKVCFSLSGNGATNEMVSATMFSYEDRRLNKRKSIKKSRFERVVKMMDISNLKIRIKIKTQFLSPNVIYGAHVVFKFCEQRKISSKLMYVNLKYQIGSETRHTYFATCGDDEWMRIELCRFIPHKKDVDFEVLLESLSRYYCGSGAIYVEGIHFRAIDDATVKVKHEVYQNLSGNTNSDSVQQVFIDFEEITQLDNPEKEQLSSQKNGKECYMLPAKMVLCKSSDVKCLFKWISIAEPESRFVELAELLSHQVFWIKCKIETQKLSSDTNYTCYLVFKLSEQCHGLQCPVKVQDVLHRKNKEFKFIYFRSPRDVNFHGSERVPKVREDGLMEVIVWEFNSGSKSSDGEIPMSLKLRCYEGTMSGLIVYGVEFRP